MARNKKTYYHINVTNIKWESDNELKEINI